MPEPNPLNPDEFVPLPVSHNVVDFASVPAVTPSVVTNVVNSAAVGTCQPLGHKLLLGTPFTVLPVTAN
jgi:hypothetical protein